MRSVKCLCWMISLCLSGIQFPNQVVSESKKKSLIHCTYKSCKIVRMCTTRRERQSMIAANILCTSNDFLFSFSSPSSSVCVWLYASRKSSPSTFVDSRLMWNQCDFTSTKNRTTNKRNHKKYNFIAKKRNFFAICKLFVLPFQRSLLSKARREWTETTEKTTRKRKEENLIASLFRSHFMLFGLWMEFARSRWNSFKTKRSPNMCHSCRKQGDENAR